MNRMKKISVIIPVYNTQDYLRECIESILASEIDLEVIAVDDGSTDGSLAVLQSFSDHRLKVYSKFNEGVYKTWQYGVSVSTGDYIIFADSDDYVDPDLFTCITKIVSHHDYDLIQHDWTEIYEKNAKTVQGLARLDEGEYVGERLKRIIDDSVYFINGEREPFPVYRWGKVFRAQLLKSVLPYTIENITMFEDDSICRPYLTQIKSLYYLPRSFYYHRCRVSGSLCNSPEKLSSYLRDCENLCAYYTAQSERFGFSNITLDYYYYAYRTAVLGEAVVAKNKDLTRRILNDEQYRAALIKYRNVKSFLLRNRLFGAYRLLRNLKNIIEKKR